MTTYFNGQTVLVDGSVSLLLGTNSGGTTLGTTTGKQFL